VTGSLLGPLDGGWDCFQILVMIICISTDLGGHGATAKGARDRKGEVAVGD
jgi:hypothetical protein